MKPHKNLFVLMLFAALSSAVAAQDGAVPAKEIQEKWVGKELIGSSGSGAKVYMQLDADGNATLSAGNMHDTGSWRISESGYCTTWKTIRAGQERCFTVTRSGSLYKILNPDGSLSGYINEVK